VGIWVPTSTLRAWRIGDLWKLDGTNYYANRTPCCEIIFNMMHGVHNKIQGKGNNVGDNHAKIQWTQNKFWVEAHYNGQKMLLCKYYFSELCNF
jgi:calcineurin-like phosphoesterase family protein